MQVLVEKGRVCALRSSSEASAVEVARGRPDGERRRLGHGCPGNRQKAAISIETGAMGGDARGGQEQEVRW